MYMKLYAISNGRNKIHSILYFIEHHFQRGACHLWRRHVCNFDLVYDYGHSRTIHAIGKDVLRRAARQITVRENKRGK